MSRLSDGSSDSLMFCREHYPDFENHQRPGDTLEHTAHAKVSLRHVPVA